MDVGLRTTNDDGAAAVAVARALYGTSAARRTRARGRGPPYERPPPTPQPASGARSRPAAPHVFAFSWRRRVSGNDSARRGPRGPQHRQHWERVGARHFCLSWGFRRPPERGGEGARKAGAKRQAGSFSNFVFPKSHTASVACSVPFRTSDPLEKPACRGTASISSIAPRCKGCTNSGWPLRANPDMDSGANRCTLHGAMLWRRSRGSHAARASLDGAPDRIGRWIGVLPIGEPRLQ